MAENMQSALAAGGQLAADVLRDRVGIPKRIGTNSYITNIAEMPGVAREDGLIGLSRTPSLLGNSLQYLGRKTIEDFDTPFLDWKAIDPKVKTQWKKMQVQAGKLKANDPDTYFERLYKNMLFAEEFGDDAFEQNKNQELRDEILENKAVDTLFRDIYSKDESYDYLNTVLTSKGKKELIQSGYRGTGESTDFSYDLQSDLFQAFFREHKEEYEKFKKQRQQERDVVIENLKQQGLSPEEFDRKLKEYDKYNNRMVDSFEQFLAYKYKGDKSAFAESKGKSEVEPVRTIIEDIFTALMNPVDLFSSGNDNKESQEKTGRQIYRELYNQNKKLLEDVLLRDNKYKEKITQPKADEYLNQMQELYKNGKLSNEDIEKAFDEIAIGGEKEIELANGEKITIKTPGLSHYKGFLGESELEDFNLEDKMKVIAKYQAMQPYFGETGANLALDSDIATYISERQDVLDRAKLNTAEVVTGVVGALADLLNGGIALALSPLGKDVENKFLSSDWAEYFKGVNDYHTFMPSTMEKAEESGGISPNMRIRKPGEEHAMLTWDTLFDSANMIKFIVPTLVMRFAGGKVQGRIAKIGNVTARNTLGKLAAFGEMAAGTFGISYAYSKGTYDEIKQQANNQIDELVEKKLSSNFEKYLKTEEGNAALQQMKQAIVNSNAAQGITVSENEVEEAAKQQLQLAYNDRFRDSVNSEYDEARKDAGEAAAIGYMVNATTETVRMAAENFLFRKWMLSRGTRANLGAENPYLRVGENTKTNTLQLFNKTQAKIKPILGNIWGGFESNYLDDVTARYGKEFGLDVFNNNLAKKYDPDNYIAAHDTLMKHVYNAAIGAQDAFYEEQSFWDGFIGALGSVVQIAPNLGIVRAENWSSTDNKGMKKSLIERVNDFIYNPILQILSEANYNERHIQKKVDAANKYVATHGNDISAIAEAFGMVTRLEGGKKTKVAKTEKDEEQDYLIELIARFSELSKDPYYREHPVVKK